MIPRLQFGGTRVTLVLPSGYSQYQEAAKDLFIKRIESRNASVRQPRQTSRPDAPNPHDSRYQEFIVKELPGELLLITEAERDKVNFALQDGKLKNAKHALASLVSQADEKFVNFKVGPEQMQENGEFSRKVDFETRQDDPWHIEVKTKYQHG